MIPRPMVRRLPTGAWVVVVWPRHYVALVLHEADTWRDAFDYACQFVGFRRAVAHDWGAGAPR